jgi:hypothetical protein
MADSLSDVLVSMLTFSPVGRVRRNHGLEHATLHVLAQRNPRRALAGHSDLGGFWIIGELSGEEVASAAQEALGRLRAGEADLALHPNCGTNYATAGILAGLAGALAMAGAGRRLRDKLERLPMAATLATLALILAQPLGLMLQQRLTTAGEPEGLEVVKVVSKERGKLKMHRVLTEG